MRSRVTTLVVLSALVASVQVLAAAPAAAMDDNGTDACLPMPGFPGLGTDSDGFCDPLEESGGGGAGGGSGGGDGSAGGGASGGGSPDEEGGEVIVIVEDVPDPEVNEPPQHQCWVRPWECGADERGHRDDSFSSMDGQEGRVPKGRGGAKPPAKKPKKGMTTLEECQLLQKRGYVMAPYLVKQKTAELQRLKRRDAVLYDRWLERRGPYTNEDAAEDVEARQIWRDIAALERELERVERAAELDCRELLRPEDFPPS